MLYQLMYSSQACSEPTMVQLEQLLEQARSHNTERDVTGVLKLVDGVFFQILEGERQVVRDLAQHIAQDPRHEELTVIDEHPIDRRNFTAWRMAYVPASTAEIARWATLDGATTIGDIMQRLKDKPDRLPRLAKKILEAIGGA